MPLHTLLLLWEPASCEISQDLPPIPIKPQSQLRCLCLELELPSDGRAVFVRESENPLSSELLALI